MSFRAHPGRACWHFCEDCSSWPRDDESYETAAEPPRERWCKTCLSHRQLTSTRRRDFPKAATGMPIGLASSDALAQEPTMPADVSVHVPTTFHWNLDGVEIQKSADHAEDLVKFAGFDAACARIATRRMDELLHSGLELELVQEKLTRHTLDLRLRSGWSGLAYRLRIEQRWHRQTTTLSGPVSASGFTPYLAVSGTVDGFGLEVAPLPVVWEGLVASIVALEGRAMLDQSQKLGGTTDRVHRP